ncbi:MAG: DUF1707 domain-containing protein [Streptosporangiales bacterium]|nr:DUF1707 domain-containing protein [Streptosporangiales bacterium]
MSSPAAGEPGHLRASDADRERVAEILRDAAGEGRLTLEELDERLEAVYAAKTYADLEPVTRDLPTPGNLPKPASSRAPAPVHHDPERFGGEPGLSSAIAIMGGATRKGDWVVPRQFTAFAIMGGIEIDMRDARFSEPTVTIHAVTIMGGIEVTVPEDATVRVTGIGVMGGFDHAASGTGSPGGPTIIIDGLALMGGVDIKRKRGSRASLPR